MEDKVDTITKVTSTGGTTEPELSSSTGGSEEALKDNQIGGKKKSSLVKKSSILSSSSSQSKSVKLNDEFGNVLDSSRDSLLATKEDTESSSNSTAKSNVEDKEGSSKVPDQDKSSNAKDAKKSLSGAAEPGTEDVTPNRGSKKYTKNRSQDAQNLQDQFKTINEEDDPSKKNKRRSSNKTKEAMPSDGSAVSLASSAIGDKTAAVSRSDYQDIGQDDVDGEECQEIFREIAEWKRKRVRVLNEWKATRRQLLRDWKDVKSKTFIQKLDGDWKGELVKQNDILEREKEKLVTEWATMKENFVKFDDTRVKAKQEELFIRWTQDRIKILKDWEAHKTDALKVWNYMRQERTRLTEEHWQLFKKNVMADFERSLDRAITSWEREKGLRETAEKERFEAMEDKRKEEWEEAKARAIADWEMRKREVLEESGKDRADALEREALNDWTRLKQDIIRCWQEEVSGMFKNFEEKKENAMQDFKKDFPDTIMLEKEFRKQQRAGSESLSDPRSGVPKYDPNYQSERDIYSKILPPSMMNASVPGKVAGIEETSGAPNPRKLSNGTARKDKPSLKPDIMDGLNSFMATDKNMMPKVTSNQMPQGTTNNKDMFSDFPELPGLARSYKRDEVLNAIARPQYEGNIKKLDSEFSSIESS